MSEVPRSLVVSYLGQQGVSPQIAAWKYYDPVFNKGRERGLVWLQQGEVRGFIGLIPSPAQGPRSRLPAWSCDWSLQAPDRSPGMGILLLKRAVQEAGHLAVFDGNHNTRSLVPRLAYKTVEGAGVVMHLYLRAGALLKKLAPRFPTLQSDLPLLRGLGRAFVRVPLPFRLWPLASRLASRLSKGPPRQTRVSTQEGVAPAIERILEAQPRAGCFPAPDLDYVAWQMGRCPALESATCYTSSAAAVLWRSKDTGDLWRMALWTLEGGQLSDVLDEAVRQVDRRGGLAITTIESHRDQPRLSLLRAKGFCEGRARVPLFLLRSQDGDPQTQAAGHQGPDARDGTSDPSDLRGLNYLSADLAYRF